MTSISHLAPINPNVNWCPYYAHLVQITKFPSLSDLDIDLIIMLSCSARIQQTNFFILIKRCLYKIGWDDNQNLFSFGQVHFLYSRLWPNEYVSSSNYKCIFLLNKCCQFSYLPSHFPPQCPGWHGLLLKCSSGHHQQCYSKKGEEINTYLRRSVSMILWHWTVLFHYSHSRIRFVNILMFSICNDFDIDLS